MTTTQGGGGRYPDGNQAPPRPTPPFPFFVRLKRFGLGVGGMVTTERDGFEGNLPTLLAKCADLIFLRGKGGTLATCPSAPNGNPETSTQTPSVQTVEVDRSGDPGSFEPDRPQAEVQGFPHPWTGLRDDTAPHPWGLMSDHRVKGI